MFAVGIAFIALIVTLLLGVPVPFAFFASSIMVVIFGGYDPSFLLPYGYSKESSVILLAIPLFVLAGGLMNFGGIGERLVNVIEVLVGRIKGGLGIVLVVACACFGAISGSACATISCIGSIMLPRMYRSGYPSGHATAMLASAGVLGLLIPPSVTMILFAWVSSQSVLACFLATVIPGITLVTLFSIVNIYLLKNNKDVVKTCEYDLKTTIKEFSKRSVSATPALVAPFIILGGIYGGIMTPTEAAAVSCIYAIPVGIWIYKGITWKVFLDTLVESVATSGVILIMLLSVVMLSRLYIMENLPQKLLVILNSISDNPLIILMIINVFLVIIGMMMDDISAILLCTPILMPVITAIGIDGIQFAAIMGVNLGMACVTPPCAPNLYLAARIGNSKINEMLRTTWYLIGFAWIPTLIVTSYVPGFALMLPRLLLGY